MSASSGSEDSDIETDESNNYYKPSLVLIAIDTHPSMFIKNEDSELVPFQHCLAACHYISDCLVLNNERQSYCQFAVILANEDSKASLVSFTDNLITTTKLLKDIKDTSLDDLSKKYMRTEDFDLGLFFLLCKKQFAAVKSLYNIRTLVYVTNDDNPINGDSNKKFTALNEARNLYDIKFQLVPMKESFDYSIFYNELYTVCNAPLVEEICIDSDGLIEKLTSLIIQRISKRKESFYPFEGHSDVFIKCYKLDYIKSVKILSNAYVSRSGKLAVKSPDLVNSAPSEFEVDSMPLTFNLEEKKRIYKNDLPLGYTLYCVSDRVTSPGFMLTSPHLLVLDETEELSYFNKFWQYCVNKSKVLICIYKTRSHSMIRFVEFIPKFVNNNRMFMVKYIPYGSETDYPELQTFDEEFSDSQIEVIKELINRLDFEYDPSFFQNLTYAKKKAYVKAELLEEDIEEIVECSVADEAVEERLSDIIEEMKNSNITFEEMEKKRKAVSTKAEGAKKKK